MSLGKRRSVNAAGVEGPRPRVKDPAGSFLAVFLQDAALSGAAFEYHFFGNVRAHLHPLVCAGLLILYDTPLRLNYMHQPRSCVRYPSSHDLVVLR